MSEWVERSIERTETDGILERVYETVTVKLKGCPFCGGRGQINHVDDEELGDGVQIWCRDCHCQTRLCEELEQAAELWNARV